MATPRQRADQARWALYNRRAGRMTPDMARAYAETLRQIEDSLDDAELERLISNGLFDRVLDDETVARAAGPLRDQIVAVMQRGFNQTVAELPNAGTINGLLGIRFNVLDPVVIEAIRALDTRVITRLGKDLRDGIRAFVENGIRDGENPREIARRIRDIVGLAPNQIQAIANYRAALETAAGGGAAAPALGYELRDRRFDPSVRSATLPPEKIDTMVAAYTDAMRAFHAETISRTATLDAFKSAQALTWNRAVDESLIRSDQLQKTWVGVIDSRERPEHVAMQGQTVPINEPYTNGEMVPGDSTWNCRCVSVVSVIAPSDAGAAA